MFALSPVLRVFRPLLPRPRPMVRPGRGALGIRTPTPPGGAHGVCDLGGKSVSSSPVKRGWSAITQGTTHSFCVRTCFHNSWPVCIHLCSNNQLSLISLGINIDRREIKFPRFFMFFNVPLTVWRPLHFQINLGVCLSIYLKKINKITSNPNLSVFRLVLPHL